MSTTAAAVLRARLVDQLNADGFLHQDWWRDAFRAVPRETFVDQFTVMDQEGTRTQHDLKRDREAALATVYSDAVLLTQLDGDGIPTSSSTAPSLMALMLEHLEARPGHHVLEVGTGTGYNSALLSHALGDDNVTTIDVDRYLTDTASAALAEAGYRPTVVCGNGANGVPERAPFDRIIATCGVDRVPAAWLGQLAPGGAILVNVSKGIALLSKQPDGSVSGRFLSGAGFMPLRAETDAARLDARAVIDATAGDADSTETVAAPDLPLRVGAFFAELVADRSQLVYLDGDDGQVVSYRWVHGGSGSWARVDLDGEQATVYQSGPRRLWNELGPILESWQAAGQPGLERYGLTVTPEGRHTLWLDEPGGPEWSLDG